MGKVLEKKKKGRPSLLDLQKRKLKEQQEEDLRRQQLEHQQLRRSHKFQNPNPNHTPTPVRRSTRRNSNHDSGDDDAQTDVVDDDGDHSIGKRRKEKKLKLVSKLPDSSANSGSLNSGSDSIPEEDSSATASHKKRKFEAIEDRSGQTKNDKAGEKHGRGSTNQTNTKLDDDGPTTPLPDEKLLLFILDRLQKKDTYGVFAEPVGPDELPDYHEVIKHPMDFSTLRKKLGSGAYANLEQFEKDVFLLCSNAMEYNAPDTIYFRQARSIQELALKNFENLRQDGDGNEPEMKIVRRGRPPTKNLKRPVGRPPLERTVSDSPGATLATGGENFNRPNNDIRKGSSLEKYALPDPSRRMNYGSRQGDVYISWSAEKYDNRVDDIYGSMTKGISTKYGKKPILTDENRRNTYNCTSVGMSDSSSALSIFHGQHKHLVPVGLQTEYGYARSLARFAAKLGPIAWKVASKKIQKCLPPGVKFGPGWVGENDTSSLASVLPSTSCATPPVNPESNDGKSLENEKGSGSLENKVSPSQPIPPATESCPRPSSFRPGPSSQAHQKPMPQPCVNGLNGTYVYKAAAQMEKLIQTDTKGKPGETKLSGNSNPEKSADCLPYQVGSGSGTPDLNVGFQSPGSPSGRADPMQPELALQL